MRALLRDAMSMESNKERRPQHEYNLQHNFMDEGRSGLTAYQMLIEQVVTGDRGFVHPVFTGSNALEQALEWMKWRDLDGYQPELPRAGVPRSEYSLGGDDVSAVEYARALLKPVDMQHPLDRSIGWK